MARFSYNLPATAPRENAHVAAKALATMQREDTAQSTSGPGWFDSSRELVRGLEVIENAPGDSAMNEWVRLCVAT
jgi:hypothetical protein